MPNKFKKITILIISTLILFLLMPINTYASSFTIAQATCDEHGNIKGGTAGDQDGGEVSMTGWNPGEDGFDYIIRAKDHSLAKKMADNMIKASENNHIGYDQGWPARKSAYREARDVDWDISAIENDCETTCSEVVNMSMRAAGVEEEYAPDVYLATDSLWDNVKDSGQFEKIDNIKGTTVYVGDILINEGKHTAMVVESPNKFLLKVLYKDGNGNDQTAEFEEESQIIVSDNNSTKPEKLQVNEEIDLNSRSPEKQGGKFVGWKYNDNKFTAVYSPTIMPIKTEAKIQKIKESE